MLCLGRVWPGLMLSSVVFGLISCPSPLAQLHWRLSSAETWDWHLWHTDITFSAENRDYCFVSGGGWGVIWRVHLEASSQYQFVVRVEDLRHTLHTERVQMAGDIILLIVPASEITHRHPPFYCQSFKRDISDINPEPLIILSSLCNHHPASLQQYRNQSQAQDAFADSLIRSKRKLVFCTRCCVLCQIIKFQTRLRSL